MEIENFKTDLKNLGKRILELKDSISNEEQTKNAFIMPLFQLLGYDVFNPTEFIPEFTADVGTKKGERVDYAISIDGKVQILIECKSILENLDNHGSQLFRYFATTNAKFGILTNGQEYRFFTDLDQKNKMDAMPFLIIDLSSIKDSQIAEILKFHKENFDIDNISSSASELKYLNGIKQFLSKNLKEPSESFVKYLASEVYEGRATQKVLDIFKPVVVKSFSQFIAENVSEKLNSALNTSVEQKTNESHKEGSIEIAKKEDEIVTTPEELEAYTVVKMLVKETLDPERVFYRDNHAYFNILLDNKINKWVLRFYTNSSKKFIVLRDDEKEKLELETPLDISQYKDKILDIVKKYM